MNASPRYIKTRIDGRGRDCRMGYAPASNADRDCFYCGHDLRSNCHLTPMPPVWAGDPTTRWLVNYADQTVVPQPGFWLDLVALREGLVAATAAGDLVEVQRLTERLPESR